MSEHTTALRTVSRTRTDLVEARVAAGNQLTALLDAHWPGAREMFADITSAISLAFLHRYPSPAHAVALGEKRMAAFLTKHGYSGRRTPAEHPDGAVFASISRAGLVNAAQIRAELTEHDAYAGPDAIAALAGLLPVTRASGKHHAVTFRWACNKRLRVAITTFAGNSRHDSPWAADIYNRARAAGKDHPHAVRIFARAWVRVLWRCWIDQRPYPLRRRRTASRPTNRGMTSI